MQVLAKHPRYLNRFYKEESQFTLTWRNHGMPDTRETVSTTQVCLLLALTHAGHALIFLASHQQLDSSSLPALQLIQEKVNGTIQGANISIEHTEAQYSLGSGIMLQVDGLLTLPEEVRLSQQRAKGSSMCAHGSTVAALEWQQ